MQVIGDVAISALYQIYDLVRIFDDDGISRKIVKLEILCTEICTHTGMDINGNKSIGMEINLSKTPRCQSKFPCLDGQTGVLNH